MWWKSRASLALFLAAMIAFAAALTGCGTDDIDISGYGDQTVTITGVTDKDITLTIADLKAMDCVTVSAESTSDKIGEVRVTGPTLDTVLGQFGMSCKDIGQARVCGRDDYDVKLTADTLANDQIILAFGIDGQPLGEEDAPLRLIIPGSDSAWWVRMVERIELTD
ncbi:MAG: molybdopterin-dependent oxidoreductase [Firmicutes bacterium]|nr:molybdopterin-dependent oxidoreductase [Bacillota bacterium]